MTSELITKQLSDAGVVALSPEARLRHLYLLGATGTGKTNLLLRLIESDVRNYRAFTKLKRALREFVTQRPFSLRLHSERA